MRYGSGNHYEDEWVPDETSFRQYTIELSERDVSALRDLKNRNGAGMGNITVENVAIWKMINQVCEK